MLKSVHEALGAFGKHVVKGSRANLTRKGLNDTRKLYDSLKFESKENKNSFTFNFFMEDHGLFKDKGVKGKNSSERAPNSPYQFGTGSYSGSQSMSDVMLKWVKRSGFQWKDKKSGKFMSHQSMAYVISRSIYNKGTKPSLFFTKPFEAAFKRLPDELIEKFGLDMETFMDNTLNKK